MLTETALAKLIVNWKSQLGTDVRGRMVVPTDTAMRVNMYKSLVTTLIGEYQYTEEDLLNFKTEKMVVDASINPKSPNKDSWRNLATEDWQRAVAEEFPMKVLSFSGKVDTSRRVEQPVPPPKVEPVPELEPERQVIAELEPETATEDGPLALDKEEFDYLVEKIVNNYDREFLVDMLSSRTKDLSKKQIDKLSKLRTRVELLKDVKEAKPSKYAKEETDGFVDPRLLRDNPLDRSIFEGLPPVNDPIDEDFAKFLKEVKGE